MSFPKWFIVVTVSGSLLFAAAKSPDKFPDVAAIGLPLLAQTLNSKQHEGKHKDD